MVFCVAHCYCQIVSRLNAVQCIELSKASTSIEATLLVGWDVDLFIIVTAYRLTKFDNRNETIKLLLQSIEKETFLF